MLVVGESFNMTPARVARSPERWARLALRLGAFHDARSQRRMLSIGLPVDGPSMNLCPPAEKWDAAFARDVAALVVGHDRVVLMGRRVQQAFGVDWQPRWGQLVSGRLVCCPHPSGLSRFWNDAWAVEDCKAMVARSLGEGCEQFRCCLCGQPCLKLPDLCVGCGRHVCPGCSTLHYGGHDAHMGLIA